jgi:hypothetical protein
MDINSWGYFSAGDQTPVPHGNAAEVLSKRVRGPGRLHPSCSASLRRPVSGHTPRGVDVTRGEFG